MKGYVECPKKGEEGEVEEKRGKGGGGNKEGERERGENPSITHCSDDGEVKEVTF